MDDSSLEELENLLIKNLSQKDLRNAKSLTASCALSIIQQFRRVLKKNEVMEHTIIDLADGGSIWAKKLLERCEKIK